jgi:hypothetical protein
MLLIYSFGHKFDVFYTQVLTETTHLSSARHDFRYLTATTRHRQILSFPYFAFHFSLRKTMNRLLFCVGLLMVLITELDAQPNLQPFYRFA